MPRQLAGNYEGEPSPGPPAARESAPKSQTSEETPHAPVSTNSRASQIPVTLFIGVSRWSVHVSDGATVYGVSTSPRGVLVPLLLARLVRYALSLLGEAATLGLPISGMRRPRVVRSRAAAAPAPRAALLPSRRASLRLPVPALGRLVTVLFSVFLFLNGTWYISVGCVVLGRD